MPTTTNNIWYPTRVDPSQLETTFSTMASSIDNQIGTMLGDTQISSYKWANQSAQTNQTGMVAGDIGYRIDNATYYTYNGTSWVLLSDTRLYCKSVSSVSSQALAASIIAKMTFATPTKNSNILDISNTGDFSVPITGLYHVEASAMFSAAAASQVLIGEGVLSTANYFETTYANINTASFINAFARDVWLEVGKSYWFGVLSNVVNTINGNASGNGTFLNRASIRKV